MILKFTIASIRQKDRDQLKKTRFLLHFYRDKTRFGVPEIKYDLVL